MKKIFTLCAALIFGATAFSQVTVVFAVDVTDYTAAPIAANGIRIGGNFADHGAVGVVNWSPSDASCAMTDQGNNIWAIAVTFDAANVGDTLSFKFVNGNWGTNEGATGSLIATDGCGADDGGGNINRQLVIPATNTTVAKVWESCADFTFANVEETAINYSVAPNPTEVSTNFTFAAGTEATVSLFDLSGKLVSTTTGVEKVTVATENLNSGSYIYSIASGDKVATGKLMKK
ncbi:MAG: hypothetical protein RIT10_1835 [Bacteroidota bacterium]|jgi:hypothetical protein